MKIRIGKLTALLVTILLLCGCSTSDSPTADQNSTSAVTGDAALVGNQYPTFPLVSQPQTLKILSTSYNGCSYDDVFVWNEYEKMTGIDIEWTTVEKSVRAETVATALSNGTQLDLIMRCKISSSRLTQYGEGGFILDLAKDDLLKNNAPNCWAYLQSHPDTLACITNPDGAIYSLPQVNSGAELRVARKIYINKTWLDNLGLEMPSTTEELYDILKAFKEHDANGNGDPNDEIPLCSQDWASIEESFYGSFGLANRGIHNMDVDYDNATGNVRFIASCEGYKDFLEYFNRLYNEGLLDSNTFSMDMEQWLNNASSDKIGVFCNTNLATIPADMADNWVAIDEALEGPNGDKMFSAIRANFHSTGAAVIPATCSDPALVLRWLDYFWTDEGTLFYHLGVEGETYVKNDDGTYDYTDLIYDDIKENNISFDDAVSKYSPYPGGSNPTVEIACYLCNDELSVPVESAIKLFEYGPDEYWPSFTFTAEESAVTDVISPDISKYVSTSQQDFITGTKPLTQWDEYVKQLEELGVSDYLEVYQAAVDRYETLKNEG